MKKMSYVSALDAVLGGSDVEGEVAERLEALKASLEKRASRKPNGPTKAQRANAEIAGHIVEAMESGVCYSTTEIAGLVPALEGATPQKVTGVMKGLVANGTVVAEKVKGKASYHLA